MLEYLAENLLAVWMAVAVICLISEMFTGGFYLACFSIGAFVASLSSLVVGIYGQLVVFMVISIVSLFSVRKFALRYFHRDEDRRLSNMDAVIGRTGTVSQAIVPGGYGRVAIDGDDWKAFSDNEDILPVGTRVKIVARNSVIIKVTKID